MVFTKEAISIGNRTDRAQIGLHEIIARDKKRDGCVRVQFVFTGNDYRQNWIPLSPLTNLLKITITSENEKKKNEIKTNKAVAS